MGPNSFLYSPVLDTRATNRIVLSVFTAGGPHFMPHLSLHDKASGRLTLLLEFCISK